MFNAVFFLMIVFGSSWLWHFFFSQRYLEFLLMIFLSIFLLASHRFNDWRKYLILIIPLLIVAFNFNISLTVFKLDDLEIHTINTRRGYYKSQVLGRFFENKLLRYWYDYKKNIFQGMDINYYFFANHPRERAGTKEVEKFYIVFFPFFILGLVDCLCQKNYLIFYYFLTALLAISLFKPVDIFSYLLAPFIILGIYYGLQYSLGKVTNFFQLR